MSHANHVARVSVSWKGWTWECSCGESAGLPGPRHWTLAENAQSSLAAHLARLEEEHVATVYQDAVDRRWYWSCSCGKTTLSSELETEIRADLTTHLLRMSGANISNAHERGASS